MIKICTSKWRRNNILYGNECVQVQFVTFAFLSYHHMNALRVASWRCSSNIDYSIHYQSNSTREENCNGFTLFHSKQQYLKQREKGLIRYAKSKMELTAEVILTGLIAFGSHQSSTGILCRKHKQSRPIRRRTWASDLEAWQQPGNCKGNQLEFWTAAIGDKGAGNSPGWDWFHTQTPGRDQLQDCLLSAPRSWAFFLDVQIILS